MHKSLYSDTRIHDWVLSFPRALLLCPLFLSLRSLPAVWVYSENKSSMEDKDIERFHCRKTSVQRGIKFVSCSALCLTVGSWALCNCRLISVLSMFEASQTQLWCYVGREVKPRLTGDISKLGLHLLGCNPVENIHYEYIYTYMGYYLKAKNDSSHSVPSG